MRALAVIGVVAFHFKLGGPFRAGGFAGVDVFFVISGFLMTQIIVGRLDRGSFSLLEFFQARVKRIVPAFVAMVVGVLAAGFVLLRPLTYETLAERAVWTLPFASNILFAKEGAYFHASAHNWLLHTWSLAVEAQFYCLFPLLLMLLRRNKASRAGEAAVLFAVALVSFAVAIWSLSAGGDSRDWSFYMLWSRAWEFLAGASCAYAVGFLKPSQNLRLSLHYSGLTAVFLAMCIFHETTPWPSLATMLPVLGTAIILLAAHEQPYWAMAMPTHRLGLWSYSIYLWHWPVAAALSFFDRWTLADRTLGLMASLLLGLASYSLVERRLTAYLWRPSRLRGGIGSFAVSLALFFAVAAWQTRGLESARYAFEPGVLAQLRSVEAARDDWFDRNYCDATVKASPFVEECRFGNPRPTDTLVVGDSFAAQLSPRYQGILDRAPYGVTFVTRHACVPLSKTTYIEQDHACEQWAEELYPYLLRSKAKRIVFTAFWPLYRQGTLCLLTEPGCGTDLAPLSYATRLDAAYRRLADLWKVLQAQGKQVIVFDVVPYPGPWGDPIKLYERIAREPTVSIEIPHAAFAKQHEAETLRLSVAAKAAGAALVDPALWLCPSGRCPIVRSGRPLYKDAHHLRSSLMKDPRFAEFDRYLLPDGYRSIAAAPNPNDRPKLFAQTHPASLAQDDRGDVEPLYP